MNKKTDTKTQNKAAGDVKKEKVSSSKTKNDKTKRINPKQSEKKSICYRTYEGHQLTAREAKFIDAYMELGNQRQAVIEAGYPHKAPGAYAYELLRKPYIAHEIEHRMEEEHQKRLASGQEVMEFFASVMRGDVKDQFNLEAPLSERIKAGQEIAKRTVDIANKIAGVKADNEVTIKLDWSRKLGS